MYEEDSIKTNFCLSMPKMTQKTPLKFKRGDAVVYPAYGVGRILELATENIANEDVQMLRISFDVERLVICVPVLKALQLGLRPLCSEERLNQAMEAMRMKPSQRRLVWGHVSEEFKKKLDSGDPVAVAETLRDLHKLQKLEKDHSFGEQNLYEKAFHRLVGEWAAVKKIQLEQARQQVTRLLDAI